MVDDMEAPERALNNHSPFGWPIALIEFEPSGKTPKSYGEGVYRFAAALTLSVILPRRGWTLIKQMKNYAYLKPPADQPKPPFRISIAVPTRAECVAIAARSRSRGESWIGQLGEWPAMYSHEHSRDTSERWRDSDTGEMASKLIPFPPQSSLQIGEWGIWYAEVNDASGDFAVTSFSSDFATPQESTVPTPIPPDAVLLEGGARSVELTAYERNPEARHLCLAHYGATCQACGLTYEEKYGVIGAGLIHVHHITPLSSVRQEYQVDPVRDLIPLCATCHHVVHGREPPYSVLELKQAIEERVVRLAGGANAK